LEDNTKKKDKIAAALCKAQGEFPILEKKSKAYNYMYADLPETLQAIQPILLKHDLCIVHSVVEGDIPRMISYLYHSSGQEFSTESRLDYRADGKVNAMQAKGSAITYAKRYNIGCLLNLAADKESDDDGEKSSPKVKREELIGMEHLKEISGWLKTFPDARQYLCNKYQVSSIDLIPADAFNAIINLFKKRYAQMKEEEGKASTDRSREGKAREETANDES